ncbi:MAG: hypothetical protein M1822_007738 [Bathelium mastoideum]|nr:MAG: hypothetical protein M1822_007738 [Bathelium mastoideum]
MLDQAFVYLTPLYVFSLVFLGVFIAQIWLKISYARKWRSIGGAPAPLIASNAFTALPIFGKAGKAHLDNRLLEWFNQIVNRGTAESPNCVQLSLTGGTHYFITREPEHIKTMLTGKFADYGKGPEFHRIWSPFLGDSIFTTDHEQWAHSRSLIRPMFMKSRVSDLEIFEKWTGVMMSKFPGSGQTFDIMDLFYRMTLDVTTDFLLGNSIDSLNNPQAKFVEAFSHVQRMQMLFTVLAPVERLVPHASYYRGIKVIEDFIIPFIDRTLALPQWELNKLSSSEKEFSFLHALAGYTRDPKVIRDQVIAVLLAGRDTTAATLSWTIYEASRYPKVWAKLRQETLDVVGPHRMPTYEDLKNMKYLTHTINETLRLYPAVPYNVRFALTNTTLPGHAGQPDIAVVKGDGIIYSTLAMQRREDLYPPTSSEFADPAVFSPDRWDHWSPKAWQYVPFNGGPRICVGQNFALTEMSFVLVRMLQRYVGLEYRGNWSEQFHKAEIVGTPGQGVPIALYEGKA